MCCSVRCRLRVSILVFRSIRGLILLCGCGCGCGCGCTVGPQSGESMSVSLPRRFGQMFPFSGTLQLNGTAAAAAATDVLEFGANSPLGDGAKFAGTGALFGAVYSTGSLTFAGP